MPFEETFNETNFRLTDLCIAATLCFVYVCCLSQLCAGLLLLVCILVRWPA